MNKNIYFVAVYILICCNIYSQNTFENNRYRTLSEIWNEADTGKILGSHSVWEGSERYYSSVYKVFKNKNGNQIYYIGVENNGDGAFYIEDINGIYITILETFIRYDSRIIWHGDNIVEIIIPTGSPFTHSYYYNFSENKLSARYNFPMYYDIENNYVLIWGNNDFELYNIETNELIRIYNYRRNNGYTESWPVIKWYVKKENNNLIMYWENMNNEKGEFIFECNMET